MVEEAEQKVVRDYVSTLREALEKAQRRHDEFIRRETRPASQEEIEEFNLFIHTYWRFRDSTLIDIPTFSHLTFTVGGAEWKLPEEILARTVDGKAISKSKFWQKFNIDWMKLRGECEERRMAQWAAEEEERRELEDMRRWGELIGEHFKASEKAYVLLLSFLTEEQKRTFWYERYFLVYGPDGERFKIENRNHGNIVAVDEGGQRYCGVCADLTPKCDSFLAQKLALENNPDQLLFISNRVDEI